MNTPDWSDHNFATAAVRAGHRRSNEGENAEAIFTTSSFVFDNAAQAADRFQNNAPGNVYSRFTNPTVRAFEQRLATLEGGEACIATASGMAAIMASCVALLAPGEHVVASSGLFGSTSQFFRKYLTRIGNPVDFARIDCLEDWAAKVTPQTRMLFVETPSNPLTQLADIRALAELANDNNALLVVDNCFCSPALQRPLDLGAHLVVHSATKFIDGQGRCVGGAVVGDKKRVGEDILGFLRTAGPTMSPFNAWVFLKGLETLQIRMQRHCESAMALALWLQQHNSVSRVYYPGLSSHPQHELCRQQQSGFGGIVSFEIAGGSRDNAWRVIDQTELLSITANLGDAKSTITHPATTTHGRLSDQDRAEAGIGEGLLRVAVGLESVDDIKADLERGLRDLSL
ncbi:O-succinylhomoserine sulfhydrylase [Chromatiales bacterium (ex Bugula neritina AB1)]|nr:O-succinylhomoserine sulfhydrylase [Chromatiales bacterium (ex Bugula neritina AB1)]